jgi:hypothetical protein
LEESIVVPIYKKGDETDCSNYQGISLVLTAYNILPSILLSELSPYVVRLFGIIIVDFDLVQLMIRYTAFIRYWRKMGIQWDST